MKQNFKENKIVTLAYDRAVLYGNVAFSNLLLSTKKSYSSFIKKGFRFLKIVENVQNFQ